MDPTTMEGGLFNMGVGCCISDQLATLDCLRKLEYAGPDGALNITVPSKQTAFNKARASSAKMMPMPSTLVWGSKYLKAKLNKGLANESCVDKCNDEARSVAHKKFAQQQQHQEQGPYPESTTMNSLLDDSINDTDIITTSQVLPGDCGDTTCSESRCSTPTPEDALALEVGHNAHEYLEECFYTEAAVLSREKFNAIPQVHKSDFEVEAHLGKGNFSDVFHVSCGRGDRQFDFAMKSLHPQIRSDEDQFIIGAEDLVHETAILANLNHRHIIKLHGRSTGQLTEAFLNDGFFILLDKLSETLHGRFATWKEIGCNLHGPCMEQMEVAHSIADAMTYLHSKKIIFRDLKPDNVGFDHNGDLKMFDFGFAIGLPEKDVDNPAGFLYDRCGTPRYMAPEVGFSLGYETKADVYSFGILLWEMCALQKPFASIKSSGAFEKQVFMGGERPPMDRRWPANVMELINGCWLATPSKRPSMIDVKSSLSSMICNNSRSKRKLG